MPLADFALDSEMLPLLLLLLRGLVGEFFEAADYCYFCTFSDLTLSDGALKL